MNSVEGPNALVVPEGAMRKWGKSEGEACSKPSHLIASKSRGTRGRAVPVVVSDIRRYLTLDLVPAATRYVDFPQLTSSANPHMLGPNPYYRLRPAAGRVS
jgi:hypothetical protein